MAKSKEFEPSGAACERIVLAGVGRDGASIVHRIDGLPDVVSKLFLTASPTRAISASPGGVRIRRHAGQCDELKAALAGAQMLAALGSVAGREGWFAPELISLAQDMGMLTVAVLVEPLLSRSPHKGESSGRLTKEIVKCADATVLFPAGQHAGAAATLSEALDSWTRRLSASVRGLLAAAAADDAMDMDFADVAAVLSGHQRATVGAGAGKTVEDALRDAAKKALAPPAELKTAGSVLAHVAGDRDMPLNDALRVLPVLEHLFPRAEVGCGVSVGEDLDEIRATIIAGKLEGRAVSSKEGSRTLPTESPFFKVGDPTVYDGENLDIPAFVRKDVTLPGSPSRLVPAQQMLFGARSPRRP